MIALDAVTPLSQIPEKPRKVIRMQTGGDPEKKLAEGPPENIDMLPRFEGFARKWPHARILWQMISYCKRLALTQPRQHRSRGVQASGLMGQCVCRSVVPDAFDDACGGGEGLLY